MSSISPDIDPLMGSISNLVTGGKRLRALMCYWGWRGAGGEAGAGEVVTAGSALELFQAAALIHDDIIDRSDTRRGGPSVHRRFSELHETQGWALDSERFGHAAAILTGDLCLSFSEESFTEIGQSGRLRKPGTADLQPHARRSHGRASTWTSWKRSRGPGGTAPAPSAGPSPSSASSRPSTPPSIRWRWAAPWPAPATSCCGATRPSPFRSARPSSSATTSWASSATPSPPGSRPETTSGRASGRSWSPSPWTWPARPSPRSSTRSWAAPTWTTPTWRKSAASLWTAARSRPRKY